MKRGSSRGLDDLLGASVKRHAPGGTIHDFVQASTFPKATAAHPSRGLAGQQRSGSHGCASSGSGGASPRLESPAFLEVSSPPPAKPLSFIGPPELPVSPFAKVADNGVPPCPVLHGGSEGADGRQQAATGGGEELDWDQENQQPCGGGSMADPAASTWLFSPVGRGRPPTSAPLPIASPHGGRAGLLSPGMATPARGAPLPTAPPGSSSLLHHAPSFSSWMVAATRPPSPPRQPRFGGEPPEVGDVVANVLQDVTAARRFDGGRPSHLDLLLGQLGDTHYPASVMQWEQEELPDSPAR